MNCTPPIISDPMKMFISIANSGNESKIFNVLTGGTGMQEVVGNFAPAGLELINSTSVPVDSTVNCFFPSIFAEDLNKVFFVEIESGVGANLVVYDGSSNSLITTIALPSQMATGPFIQSTIIYYINGYVIICTQSAGYPAIIAINATTYAFNITLLPLSSQLQYTDIDMVNNRLYVCDQVGFRVFQVDVSNPSLASLPYVSISTIAFMQPLLCRVGARYLAVGDSGNSHAMIIDLATFAIVGNFNTASSFIGMQYACGSFVLSGVAGIITFLPESDLTYIAVPVAGLIPYWFARQIKNDRYAYIAYGNGFVECDALTSTCNSVSAATSVNGAVCYNKFSDSVNFLDFVGFIHSISTTDPAANYTLQPTFSGDNAGYSTIISPINGDIYWSTLSSIPVSQEQILAVRYINKVPVSVVYNGGANSSEYINNSLVVMPIKTLKIKFQSSSQEELLNLLTKIRQDSTGTFKSFQIENSVKFNADDRQYIAEFSGDELGDPVFDGTTYLQGLINPMSNLSISLDYVQYNASNAMTGDCREDDKSYEPIKPVKRTCIFYNRKLF